MSEVALKAVDRTVGDEAHCAEASYQSTLLQMGEKV